VLNSNEVLRGLLFSYIHDFKDQYGAPNMDPEVFLASEKYFKLKNQIKSTDLYKLL